MTNYPTAWQRRVLWTIYTYLAIVAAGAVAVMLLSYFGQAVGFLQPVLIPFALAAVLAFLLDPVVRLLTTTTRLSRRWAVFVVLGVAVLLLVLLFVWWCHGCTIPQCRWCMICRRTRRKRKSGLRG